MLETVVIDAVSAGVAITFVVGLSGWAISSGIAVIRRALGA